MVSAQVGNDVFAGPFLPRRLGLFLRHQGHLPSPVFLTLSTHLGPCVGFVARFYRTIAVFLSQEPRRRTGGVKGPDLFPKAVNAFRRLLRVAGGKEG
jgi:hypothetical protein